MSLAVSFRGISDSQAKNDSIFRGRSSDLVVEANDL